MTQVERYIELIQQFLPPSLFSEKLAQTLKAVKDDWPHLQDPHKFYQTPLDPSVFYQGDIVQEIVFPVLDPSSPDYKTRYYTSAILSNTCDIDLNNPRKRHETFVVFGAVYPLQDYLKELQTAQINAEAIQNFLNDLKNQRVTDLFYLPAFQIGEAEILAESFIRFDHVSTLQRGHFHDKWDKSYALEGDRLCTLSDAAFYLLLFKLSVHFCRFSPEFPRQ